MELICRLEQITPGSGVCALYNNEQVALFRPYDDDQVFAISNIDPFYQASVLSRGLICEHQQTLWVASPLKKQHFRLEDGYCLEDPSKSIKSYKVEVKNAEVYLA